MADIAGLRQPSRTEAVELLVATLHDAVRQIPPVPAAWSWAEFEHAGMYAVHQLVQADDQARLRVCAFDLGLAAKESPQLSDVASEDLSRNLTAAIERLLRNLHEQT